MEAINAINALLWSTPMLVLVLGGGLFFTVITGVLQIRHLKEMIRLMFKGISTKKVETGVSSFQALAMSVASRVGTGNIAGVATAIALGGPGAVFWMWMVALFGAATSFVECTLAQIYKVKVGNEFRGGPSYYLERGAKKKWVAKLFAVATLIAYGWCLYTPQSNTIAVSMKQAFGISEVYTGIGLCVLFFIIIFGGVKRISTFAEFVVPFMAVAYVLVAIAILVANITELPAVFALIVKSAFNAEQAFAGMIGSAISWGVKRGIYSNEAGQGTAPHAAAAADVEHPAEQGFIQALSVYIDTLVVCSATAFMILLTGQYNVVNPAGGFLLNNIGNVDYGPIYTQLAVDTLFNGFGSIFVAIAVLFFAFTSIIAVYYYAETNLVYLMGKEDKKAILVLKVVVMSSVFYGTIKTSALIWGLADLGVGLMAWVNIIGILMIFKPAIKALRDYEEQKSNGIDEPTFDPKKLGIENAEFWEVRCQEKCNSDKVHSS